VGATLKDVALKAGVSVKTVSNVVNGYVHVTEDMRARVLAALKELNYQPNLSARYLRTKHVGVLAFVIPDLSNAYFSDIGNSIIDAAASQSYTVLIDHSHGERSKELLVVNGLRPHLIDGIILHPIALQAEDLRERTAEIPLVLLGEHFFVDVPYDHISIDNIAAARLATTHLLAMGKRRIAAIGAPEGGLQHIQHSQPSTGVPSSRETALTPSDEVGDGYSKRAGSFETARQRLEGYVQALTEAGLPLDPQLVVFPGPSDETCDRYYHREGGAEAMRQLLTLKEPPDAVFCFNDLMALGAIRALHQAGLRIPDDVAVIGYDDIEEGRYATPSLTTIAPDKKQLGELAVSFLIGRINKTRTALPETVEVPFQLIVRESTQGRK
jgi:DNA-binding LacI/PurR family transcriptional regulator